MESIASPHPETGWMTDTWNSLKGSQMKLVWKKYASLTQAEFKKESTKLLMIIYKCCVQNRPQSYLKNGNKLHRIKKKAIEKKMQAHCAKVNF